VTSSPTASWSFDPASVDVGGDLTFVVVRRSGTSLKGFKVEVASEAQAPIRRVCADTLTRLASRHRRDYEPSLSIDPAAEYLAVPDALLQRSPVPPKPSAVTGNVCPVLDRQLRDVWRDRRSQLRFASGVDVCRFEGHASGHRHRTPS
jgi:hypothetical protein